MIAVLLQSEWRGPSDWLIRVVLGGTFSGTGGLRFDSWAGQIRRSAANDSYPLQSFSETVLPTR